MFASQMQANISVVASIEDRACQLHGIRAVRCLKENVYPCIVCDSVECIFTLELILPSFLAIMGFSMTRSSCTQSWNGRVHLRACVSQRNGLKLQWCLAGSMCMLGTILKHNFGELLPLVCLFFFFSLWRIIRMSKCLWFFFAGTFVVTIKGHNAESFNFLCRYGILSVLLWRN